MQSAGGSLVGFKPLPANLTLADASGLDWWAMREMLFFERPATGAMVPLGGAGSIWWRWPIIKSILNLGWYFVSGSEFNSSETEGFR